MTVQTKLSVAKIQQLSVSLGMGNNGPDSVHSVQRSRFADVKLFSIIALSAIIVIVVYGNVVWRYSEQPEDAGLFGDSFGAVNALFSALAFAAVFVALRLQRLDLEEQKKELKETQKHIEDQARTLALQRFETTFFSMLRNYAESRNGFRQHDRTGLVAIQTDISALQGTMVNEMGLSRQDSQLSGSADELDKFRTHIINHFHRDEGAIVQLAHQIDSILQFIARSKLSREEKTVYAEILANSLSLSELGLVFFVAQLEGFQELTQALQDFGFLRNLPQSYANRWSCVSRLGSGAFSRHP